MERKLNFEVFQPNIENMENYMKENAQRDASGPVWWSIPSGLSVIRILPPWDATGRVALPVYSHSIEFQGEGMNYKKYTWTCTKKTFDKPCKICEGLQRLADSGVNVDEYQPTRRQFYFNALVMYDPVYDAGIKAGKKESDIGGVAPGTLVLLKSPKVLYDWIVSQITNPMVGDITSIDNGIDIYVTKEGSGLGTKYTPTLSPNGRVPVPKEYLDKIEALYNLDEIFSVGFDDELVNKLVTHLESSSNYIAGAVPNVVQSVAGYNIAPQPNPYYPQQANMQAQAQVVQPTTTVPVQPNPYATVQSVGPVGGASIASTNPFAVGVQQQIPMTPVAPVAPVNPVDPFPPQPTTTVSSVSDVKPECYGQYNPSSVNCVVCSHELQCSQDSK